METISSSTQKTKELADQLASQLSGGEIILLTGELGAGKTTFTGFLAKALGFDARVQSPTFILHRIYRAPESNKIVQIHHLDLYRLTEESEFEDLGIDEMATSDSVVIIEWPNKFLGKIKGKIISINFEVLSENERKIQIQNLH